MFSHLARSPGWRSLLSTLLLFCLSAAVFHALHLYDWGQPVVKLLCFQLLLFVCLTLRLGRQEGPLPAAVPRIEIVLFAGLLLLRLFQDTGYLHLLFQGPLLDIGLTTQEAARAFFLRHEDPYRSAQVFHIGHDPRFWGYKYGPVMFLGYFLSALLPVGGIKLSNLGFLLLSAVLCLMLCREPGGSRRQSGAHGLSVLLLLFLPERLCRELLEVGVIDIFPVFLLLLSVLLVDRQRFAWAGLLAGLSLSAKLVPAAPFILIFVRRDLKFRFFAGVLLGTLPLFCFWVVDPTSLQDNLLVFLWTKPFDSTSLYSVVPRPLHILFPLFQAAMAALVLLANFRRPLHPRGVVVPFTVLLLAIEVSYREIHENHLIWLMPFLALIFTWYRHRFLSSLLTVGRALGMGTSSKIHAHLGPGPAPQGL